MNVEDWKYLSHGGANVVLRYVGSEIMFVDKVLRLRRRKNGVSTRAVYNYIKHQRFDSLREWIVRMELIPVSKEFSMSFGVDHDSFGILMPNLLGTEPEEVCVNKYIKLWKSGEELYLEVKPKWLNDRRGLNCRNCIVAQEKNQEFVLCPLWLLQGKEGVDFWCRQVQARLAFKVQDHIQRAISGNIHLLEALQKMQTDNKDLKTLCDEELQFQMTIRDVSVVYNLSTGSATVLDLDLKPLTKKDTWINTEKRLEKAYNMSIGLECP